MSQEKFSLLRSERNALLIRRREIRNLLKMLVHRLENLCFHPWKESEYVDLGWDYRDAAREFSSRTGCDLDSAIQYFNKIEDRVQADYDGCSKLDWLMYFASKPRLPKEFTTSTTC